MPVRTVGEYLRRWGYTAKVPRRHAKDQDPEEVRKWLEETYPAIEWRGAPQGARRDFRDRTRSAGSPRGGGDPLVRRAWRGGRPATATGLRPRGGSRRGPTCPTRISGSI